MKWCRCFINKNSHWFACCSTPNLCTHHHWQCFCQPFFVYVMAKWSFRQILDSSSTTWPHIELLTQASYHSFWKNSPHYCRRQSSPPNIVSADLANCWRSREGRPPARPSESMPSRRRRFGTRSARQRTTPTSKWKYMLCRYNATIMVWATGNNCRLFVKKPMIFLLSSFYALN